MKETTKMSEIHRIAFAVTDPLANAPEGAKARWNKAGVTFQNKDGSETVLLDTLPLSGKLVLQEPKADDEPAV
jgi:hypothetical protein